MRPTAQELTAAASDSYKDRRQSNVNDKGMLVHFDGRKYSVFACRADPATGFHATAYMEMAPPHHIIIAYRGTDPDFKHHTRTTVQDALVDFTMVKDQVNPQEAAARAFTREVLEKAQALGIAHDLVTVAGHSLGGTLAEIEAFRFGLRGATFNAYGAVDLGYGVPAGGEAVTNYVMAGDVVSAASRHYGRTITLASEADIAGLRAGRYLDAAPGAPPPNPLLAMRLGDHGSANFMPAPGRGDPLAAGNLAQAEARYTAHREAIDRFRGDVATDRAELAVALAPAMKPPGTTSHRACGSSWPNITRTWSTRRSGRRWNTTVQSPASRMDWPGIATPSWPPASRHNSAARRRRTTSTPPVKPCSGKPMSSRATRWHSCRWHRWPSGARPSARKWPGTSPMPQPTATRERASWPEPPPAPAASLSPVSTKPRGRRWRWAPSSPVGWPRGWCIPTNPCSSIPPIASFMPTGT